MVGAVIDRLGYQPSNLARSLIQGRSCSVGVVGSGLKYFGPASSISAIEERANILGYSLLLTLVRQPETNEVEQILSDMLSRHVDGIVWAVPEIEHNRDWIVNYLPQIPVPVVFLSMQPRAGLSVIEFDNRGGGRMAAQHLLARGYRNIGLITGPLDWWAARQRMLGWQEALEEAGSPSQKDLIVEGDWSPASGELALFRLLEMRPDVEAVFACNDQMALGALKAAGFKGLKVPGDLAVIGFDDVPEAAFFCPPLTTIRQDMAALGYCAMKELSRRMNAIIEGNPGVEPDTIWIQPQLVIRESTGKQGGRIDN
jgi:LacI family transcriptional regulator